MQVFDTQKKNVGCLKGKDLVIFITLIFLKSTGFAMIS